MSSWCLSCIPWITRSTKDDGAIFHVQLQCLSHRQCSLLHSYNTESLAWTSQQVNVVELGCVWVCARKSGKAGDQQDCSNVGSSEMGGLQHTHAQAGFLSFIVFGVSVTADFELTYSTRFGILFKPWACSLFATPATCIPPYCLAVVMPLPQATETVWVW